MTLELVVGPVRSGKLGALLGRFSEACEAGRRPLLLVPAAFERDALERDACERTGALLGGEVVTLDTLVERVLGGEVEVASEALERVAAAARRARATGRRSACGPSRSPRRSSGSRASATARVHRRARWSAHPAAMHASRPPTPPTRQRWPRPVARAAAGSSCAPPSGSSASLPPGTGLPSSRTASTTCRPRSCACWPRWPGAAISCSRSRTSPHGRCWDRWTSPSNGWPRAPSESRSCVRRRTARRPAPSLSHAGRSRRAASPRRVRTVPSG